MRLFLDTADIKEIESAVDLGVISGITTNQTILAREGSIDLKEHIKKITSLIDAPISIEIPDQKLDEMIQSAIRFSELHKNIVIKVPMLPNGDGLRLVTELQQKNIPTNITVLMTSSQGILATLVGGTYISLFFNRILEDGRNPQEIIGEVRTLIDETELPTQIIAGSIRKPADVVDAFISGAHIVTLPYKVLNDMISHHTTNKVLAQFDESWKKMEQSCTNLI